MAFLLYCIMRNPPPGSTEIRGIQGTTLTFVAWEGLCAAVSCTGPETGHPDVLPPVSELLAYARVVEELCDAQTAIPMRYGCFLDGLPEIRHSLESKAEQYAALLSELDGRVEMGIRFFLPVQGRKPQATGQDSPTCADGAGSMRKAVPRNESTAQAGQTPGLSYLAARREQYRIREENCLRDRAILDAWVLEFSELKARHRSGSLSVEGRESLSLDFLVLKHQVARFRELFRLGSAHSDLRMQISGPWPPYSFVTLQDCTGVGKGENRAQNQPS